MKPKKWQCIRRCFWGNIPAEFRLWEVGEILIADECPNHHFVSLDPDLAEMDPFGILEAKLKELGMWDEEKMRYFTFMQLQGLFDSAMKKKKVSDYPITGETQDIGDYTLPKRKPGRPSKSTTKDK